MNVKTKGIQNGFPQAHEKKERDDEGMSSGMGIVGTHPGSFRKSGKQRSCGIRNLEEHTEKKK
jgi:hypothetical protein